MHLRKEVQDLEEEIQLIKFDRDKVLRHNELTSSVDVLNEASSQASTSYSRPYSSFIDLNNIDSSASLHHSEDSAPDLSASQSEAAVIPEHMETKESDSLDRNKKKAASMKKTQKYVLTKNGSSPVHNSKT